LRRDDVEPLRTVFADHMHRAAAAATASGIFRFDDDLDPRQVLGQVFRHHRNEIGRDKAGVGNPG